MRRKISTFIALVLTVCLAGCGSSPDTESTSENPAGNSVENVSEGLEESGSDGAETEREYTDEIKNGDFETKDFTGWDVEDDKGILLVRTDDWAVINTSYFVKVQATCDGTFTVSQKIKASETDSYVGAINYEGFESFGGKITFSVLVNDSEAAAVDITPSRGWDVWDTASTDPFDIKEGDIITLQVTGDFVSGDWADFDDIRLIKSSEAQEALGGGIEITSEILAEGAVGSGCIDWKGVTYNGVNINGGNFIKGVDISSLISLENSGVVYYNAAGEEQDLISLFKDAGINYVRLRVWNDPYAEGAEKTPENSYGGGVCDLEYTCRLAERCAALDIPVFIDFHYSDFWTDPGRGYAPKAWAGYSLEEKKAAIAEYTTDALEKIKETGVEIGIVSVGNETTGFMAGEEGIEDVSQLIAAGCSAVRSFDDSILIAVHFTNPESFNYYGSATQLYNVGADYDIFSTSYYATDHGTTDNLISKMNSVAQDFGKLTMLAEYKYPTSGSCGKYVENTFGTPSPEGQTNAIRVINETAAQIDNCIGTFYWEPAWIQAPSDTWATQGSGWFNAPAAEYDKANSSLSAAQGSGTWESALFDEDGHPYDALTSDIFHQIWTDGE